MYGLVLIGIFLVYLLISIAVVTWAARQANAAGGSPVFWGALAALMMYLLVFWDHVPTVITHEYYCANEAGFWAYKTPEQWMKENPGVMETLVRERRKIKGSEDGATESVSTYALNQRIAYTTKKTEDLFLNRQRWERVLIDQEKNEVLARYIDFSRGRDSSSNKFWLKKTHCAVGESNGSKFRVFRESLSGREQ